MNRRTFLAHSSLALSATALPGMKNDPARPHLVTNVYPWLTFYRRNDQDFYRDLPAGLDAVAESGALGFEGMGDSPEQIRELGALLEKRGLDMRSLYVNSVLHDPEQAEASIQNVLAIADAARSRGTSILVTNPSPIRWGGPENKSDAQLVEQAANLDRLGAALAARGIRLAYHNHDIELREGAREFHHMLTATNPENVKFCLDAHWVYRGCGNSEVALFDAVEHYHERIIELHLRQSRDGVWSEVFSMDGDIDYHRLFHRLHQAGIQPLLVLEQAVEADSPHTLDAVTAHKKGIQNLAAALG